MTEDKRKKVLLMFRPLSLDYVGLSDHQLIFGIRKFPMVKKIKFRSFKHY